MAYDEELADRIRELIGAEPNVTEKKMFGGLAFLIQGNMAVAASGQGGVLVRADPDESDRLVASSDATFMEMGGRRMGGWLRVAPEHLRTRRQLARWVGVGTAYARTLPAKKAAKKVAERTPKRSSESWSRVPSGGARGRMASGPRAR